MESQDYLESINNLDEIVNCTVQMDDPNVTVSIFTGEFLLVQNDIYCKVKGKIEFKWFPYPIVKFEGEALDYNFSPFQDIISGGYILQISELPVGIAQVTNFLFDKSHRSLTGILTKDTLLGDTSMSVEKIRFSVPNLREINGEPVVKFKDEGNTVSNSRLMLSNKDYLIKLDKISDYKIYKRKLINEGGYLILYGGEIIPNKGFIKFKEVDNLFFMFSTFLSFLNGRRVSLFFSEGIYGNEVVWKDFTNYKLDIYAYSPSWLSPLSIHGLIDLWQQYSDLWSNGHSDFLYTAIHWYNEANKKSAALEGAIVIAQTAIELLFNWYIVESKQMIIGKDSENLSAANKIRLLISQLGVSPSVPLAFAELDQYVKISKDLKDAPDAIVQIRNAIVHSQIEKRKKIASIDPKVKYQALELTIWYIEVALLKILNFKGHYINRCAGQKFMKEEKLP